jgi:Ca2+-transporting ATPase
MEALQRLGGVTGLASKIQSDAHNGVDPAVKTGPSSIEEHRRVFGANTMPAMPQKNFFMLCFENVQDPIILLLIAAALVRVCSASRHSGCLC